MSYSSSCHRFVERARHGTIDWLAVGAHETSDVTFSLSLEGLAFREMIDSSYFADCFESWYFHAGNGSVAFENYLNYYPSSDWMESAEKQKDALHLLLAG